MRASSTAPLDPTRHSLLLSALAAEARRHPTDAKLLVCSRSGTGRELLHALAIAGCGWIGYTARTPGQLAGELVGPDLARERLERIDDFARIALIDEAIDEVLVGHGSRLEEQAETAGFRRAVGRTLGELRNAGLGSLQLARSRLDEAPKRDAIAAILAHYERRLVEHGRVDGADVMARAVAAIEAGRVVAPESRVYLLPGLRRGGLVGRFLDLLLEHGAVVLDSDPVVGVAPPAGVLATTSADAEDPDRAPDAADGAPSSESGEGATAAPADDGPGATSTNDDGRSEPPDEADDQLRLSLEADAAPRTRTGWTVHGEPPRGMARASRAAATGGASAEPGASTAGHGAASTPGLLSYLHATGAAPRRAEPRIDLFAAASPADEVREVLRRIVAAGRRWDEVEIIATDRDVYGVALDSIAAQLDIPVTHAAGLPLGRTRVGRAVAAYLRWIQDDFPDQVLRELLQANMIAPAGPKPAPLEGGDVEVSGPGLARRLRRLRIGWGRDRYLRQIDRALAAVDEPPATDDELEPEEAEAARQRDRAELESLRRLLGSLLDATPEVGDRLGTTAVRLSPAAIAAGLLRLLELVPARRPVEIAARHLLRDALGRIEATLRRQTAFSSALAILRHHLEGLRVASPAQPGRPPWGSAGGALHFSDLEHGGLSGRRCTFVVGLDSSRFPGPLRQDPLLLDGDRRRLTGVALATTAERLEERRWALASLLARLRGQVTFSYSAWEAAEGRSLAPASVLLQALRLQCGDAAADYERLRRTLGAVRGPICDGDALDGRDAWLASLSSGSLLLDGGEVVRAAHPGLAQGLAAFEERRGSPVATAHWGLISPRPAILDPRRAPDMLVSASRLETLGRCPLRYFYRYVLEIRPPEEPDADLGAWLDPRERGKLLHGVYEAIVDEATERDLDPSGPDMERLAEDVLRDRAELHLHRLPAPSRAVFENELLELRRDLDVFLKMLREAPSRCIATELRFGFREAEHDAVPLNLRGGTIRLRGAVDRVDETPSGDLLIVDYKTGSSRSYSRRKLWDGGRRLQHALYTAAAERLLGRPVAGMEYHFPTQKGQGRRTDYPRSKLASWPIIVATLLELVERGHFVPTDESRDCAFCDYGRICRVEARGGYRTASPPAEWAAERWQELDEYAPLRKVRRADD